MRLVSRKLWKAGSHWTVSKVSWWRRCHIPASWMAVLGRGSAVPSLYVDARYFLPPRRIGVLFRRGGWVLQKEHVATVHGSCPRSALGIGSLEHDFHIKSQGKASAIGRI